MKCFYSSRSAEPQNKSTKSEIDKGLAFPLGLHDDAANVEDAVLDAGARNRHGKALPQEAKA